MSRIRRSFTSISIILFIIVGTISCSQQGAKAPVAKIVPHKMVEHGHERIDNYFWMNERDNPDVIKYLNAENLYTEEMMEQTKGFQKKLFEEFKARIRQNDESVPFLHNGYYYYYRTAEGKDYPIFCRKKQNLDNSEEITLDVNSLAKGHKYYNVDALKYSPDNDLLAFAVDTLGRRKYEIFVKNLKTGEILSASIRQVTPNFVWANDNKNIFYTRQDPQTLREYQIYRHDIGKLQKEDKKVYEETDDTFSVYLSKTKSESYIFIISDQTLSTEYRYLNASEPYSKFKVFLPRKKNHEYHVDHFGKYFYIISNDKAKNFKLMKTPVNKTAMKNWREVIPHREDVLLKDIEIFKKFLVVSEKHNGLTEIQIRPWKGNKSYYMEFPDPAYSAYTTNNYDFNTEILRYRYSSLTTPNSVYDFNMRDKKQTLLKRDDIRGGFKSEDYQSERLMVKVGDGALVPVSLVYRKEIKKKNGNPLLLYAYGSYGYGMSARFSPYVISLLNRGFVYAIAHVRGGDEMGRQWYEDGKLLKKKNTFTDFIDCADYLVKSKYADPKNVFASGGSAGGLLMGAIVNMRPNLWKGVIAAVPFVDVVTTMLDESIPLTTAEYDEWGNPHQKEYYDYILSYSPYDNVTAETYPNLLVLTSYQDSQVQYWEPAKWVAKLRALKTDDNLLLLKTQMQASHGGSSGRYERYKENAFEYAFLLHLAAVDQ